ncbi:hypothetical protein POM88_048913 [Heracleum sosnowskyi]|uniref:Uncharacterized protein n=1 Tax=Heracleum sosnowskyi TaxID=360622 RepID=A0AAD8GUN2_9APIA|nr:hypothetical protein POM88_048913 [Heracleum sosnowskyi]
MTAICSSEQHWKKLVYGSTRVQTSVVQGLEDAKVSNLFKTGLNEWDYDLLRDIFNQEDVERIVKIPVAHTNQGADKWIWLEDVKGLYTVKSGYRLLSNSLPQFSASNLSFKWLRLEFIYSSKGKEFRMESDA